MAAVTARRTGRMGDIVATIQAEQDRIIRATPSGVLVVQGGPGTGKTAVALHRAAYLLYTHRDRLARRGVLVVGPNATFLRYIGQVLPSLGETSVVLGTVGQLFPGLDARRAEAPEVAEVKGRPEMAGVIAAAVRDRQQVPRRPVELVVEQQRVRLDRRRGQRRPLAGAAVPAPAQRGQADLPPGGGAAARRAGGAQPGRPGLARPAGRRRPVRHPRRAGREPGADPRAGRAVADAVAGAAAHRPVRRPAPAQLGRPPAARGGPGAARPAAHRRRHPRRPVLDPRGRPAARRGRRAARRRRLRAAGPRGGGAARGGACTPRACSTCSTSRRTSTRSCCAPRTSSTRTGSPSASGCAATTPRRTGRRRTASGPTAT